MDYRFSTIQFQQTPKENEKLQAHRLYKPHLKPQGEKTAQQLPPEQKNETSERIHLTYKAQHRTDAPSWSLQNNKKCETRISSQVYVRQQKRKKGGATTTEWEKSSAGMGSRTDGSGRIQWVSKPLSQVWVRLRERWKDEWIYWEECWGSRV